MCTRCDNLAVEKVNSLLRIGGHQNPYCDPGGELWKCRACGAFFIYTRDHDNALGYVDDPPSLTPIDSARALSMAEECVVITRRDLAHWEQFQDEYRTRFAQQCRDELRVLAEEIALLKRR